VLAKPVLTVKILTTIVIQLLLVIGLVSLAWVVLKSRYDRRGRQLFDERVAHVRAQTKTEERTHLAAELHDAVSQSLTGIALQIDSASIVNRGDNPALTKCLVSARQMLALCRRELRDCLWDLRSRTFDEKDMTEAVSRAIAPHSGNIKATVRFNVPRGLLSESKVHCILSIARELVVNSVRHGKATKLWIAGECSNGRISFSVRDNGCGFDVSAAPGPDDGHFGLRGVCERVRAAKGTIKIESAPGSGTKTTITLPDGE
jgi:signal transduction histidine kinase